MKLPLGEAGLGFETEDQIKRYYSNGKVVDFIINDENSNIFVESKAVEIAPLGRVTHESQIIRNHTKNTVIKGIHQALETAYRLHNSSHSENKYKVSQSNYVLIVTYRDLFVGSGLDYYRSVAKDKLDELLGQYQVNGEPIIPIGNILYNITQGTRPYSFLF